MSAELFYQIEPELLLGTPRPARVKRQEKIALVWLAGIGLTVALVIGWFAARDISDLYTLRTRGVTAKGVISGKRKSHSKSDSYYISYSLHTVDANVEDEVEVVEALYEEKTQGDTIPVTYLPGHGQTYRVGHVTDRRIHRRSLEWGLGMLFGSGLFGLGFIGMSIAYNMELRLARDGVSIPGIISECVAPLPNTRESNYTITYRFGPPFEAQIQTCSVSVDIGKQLAAGQTVTVLYDAADPRRFCLYCGLRYTEILLDAAS